MSALLLPAPILAAGVHAPDTLAMPVARAAERAFVPASLYFLQMLDPFAALNDPGRKAAGAAGGRMLVERPALERAGGLKTIGATVASALQHIRGRGGMRKGRAQARSSA